MSNNDKFLSVYKDFESTLRNQNIDFKELENQGDSLISNRLRICRQIRNYLSHNNDSNFIETSRSQIKFLEEMNENQKMKDDIVKKHLGRVNSYTCSIYDKCTEVLAIMSKRGVSQYPVLDEIKGTYEIKIVSIYDIANAVLESKTKRIKDILKFDNNFTFVDPLYLYIEVSKDIFTFCTSDGTKDGKILGIVK